MGWAPGRSDLISRAGDPALCQTGRRLMSTVDRNGALLGMAAVSVCGKAVIAVPIVTSAQVGTSVAN